MQVPQQYTPHYLRLDGELARIVAGFAPFYKTIDDQLVEVNKERLECAWRIGKAEHDLKPYKAITLQYFLQRVYSGR